jgi:hypothetical protein
MQLEAMRPALWQESIGFFVRQRYRARPVAMVE